MHYHPDDFLSLVDEVEQQGGGLLQNKCKGRKLAYQNQSGNNMDIAVTAGCGKQARFAVHYLDRDTGLEMGDFDFPARDYLGNVKEDAGEVDFDFSGSKADESEPQFAPVCAVDDAMGLWPRFANSMLTGESYEGNEGPDLD